jgi:hypothetical protein
MTREPEMVCLFHARKCEQLRDPCLPHDWPDDPDDPHGFPIPDDDSHWDVFIPDDDEIDPLPDPGDFWVEPEDQQGARSMERGVSELADAIAWFP